MFRFKYGTYTHDEGECGVSVDRQTVFDQTQTPTFEARRYVITGTLVADSISAMATKISTLMDAYDSHNKDILLLNNTTPLDNSTLVANTRNGVRVVKPPSFPNAGAGAQYHTFLNYSIELECEVSIDAGTNIRTFQETVEQTGGGPRFEIIEPNIGRPILQRGKQATAYRYTQSGTAVGITSYPTPPNPIWPNYLIENPRIRRNSPGKYGFGTGISWEDYEISWSYSFASDVPLYGLPNVLGASYSG